MPLDRGILNAVGVRLSDEVLRESFGAIQDAFRTGRLDDLMEFFVIPLVIYSSAGVTLVRDREQLLSMTEQYRETIRPLEIVTTEFQIEHRDAPFNSRFRTTVRFAEFREDGKMVTSSLIRYFLIDRAGSYKIEMIEYLELPIALSEVERIVH